MLPKFGNFIVAYLILLTWLFNVDLSDSFSFCSKKKSEYHGNIRVGCYNNIRFRKVVYFEYNKNMELDVDMLRDIMGGKIFGIYILGYNETEPRGDQFVNMAYSWSLNKKSTVCVVEHTEWEHGLYYSVKYRLPYVGEVVGELLIKFENLRMIDIQTTIGAGFGIGAHMVGKAFEFANDEKKKRPSLIIGIEPVRLIKKALRLTKRAARYVQILCGSILCGNTFGHANFKLNGKLTQPGCKYWDWKCRHNYAQIFFSNTIDEEVIATEIKNPDGECSFGITNTSTKSGNFEIWYKRTRSEIDEDEAVDNDF